MRPRTFADGDVLIRQGEAGRALHVVTAGVVDIRVRTPDGVVAVVAQLAEGQCVGEMSLLTGDPASADVVAAGAVETLSLDAGDFTTVVASHPQLLRQFVQILSRRLTQTDEAVGEARGKEQDLTEFLREADQWDDQIVGKSAGVRTLRAAIERAAPTDSAVLVRGANGTGRELVARMLHRRSSRADALVIAVDCALIAETEWGDKLLGGQAAAEARGRSLSYVELASGGTLVLKNLGRLPAGVQDRLADELDRGDRVRIIATTGTGENGGSSSIAPRLLAHFGGDVIEVPALCERKRDIPLLAEHYLKKHAARLGKPAGMLSDQAITALVSYDFGLRNDRELEQAIERAVILTDGETIEAETIFLGPPPPPRVGAVNLFALAGKDLRRLVGVLPRVARVATALFFAYVLYEAFFGPSQEGGNTATLLVWSLWWPVLVLSFFFAGRAWCAACPMGLATALGERWRGKPRRIPSWMKKYDVPIAMAGLFLIVLVEETTGMRHSPFATGLLLLAILTGAAVTGLLYPRRTWCRHVCPLGGLAGVCSTSGLLEVRPTFDICSAKCQGHACFKGDEHVAGCPMFNHVMFVDTNQHCVLCMNCVQSCPNDSPQLNVRLPGREIWGGATVKPEFGRFVLLLLGLLAAMTTIQHVELAHPDWLTGRRFVVVTAVLAVGAVLPLLIARPFARRAERAGPDATQRYWHRVAAFVPLVTAGFVAYHLQYLPGLEWLNATLEYGDTVGAASRWSLPVLGVVRFGILSAGLLTTAIILWRVERPVVPETSGLEPTQEDSCDDMPARRRDPVALAAIVGYWALLLGLMLAR